MVTVTLNDDDYQLAVRIGSQRHKTMNGTSQPSMPIIFEPAEHLIQNIRSTAAEIAVARYLDTQWLGEQYGGPLGYDVFPNIEVRTRNVGKGLYIKDREVQPGKYRKKPADRFVLVWQTDNFQQFQLPGFIQLDYGWSRAEPWRKDGKLWGWQVNINDLWPIEKLKQTIA